MDSDLLVLMAITISEMSAGIPAKGDLQKQLSLLEIFLGFCFSNMKDYF